jgi:hypothetical protein
MDTADGAARYSENGEGGHALIRTLLPAYAAAVTLGQPLSEAYPQMARHLEGCPACQAELARLLQLIEPLYDGTLEPAQGRTALDLSFLPEPPMPALPAKQAESQVATQRFGTLDRLVLILDQQLEALRNQVSGAFGRPALLRPRGSPLIDYEPNPATTGGVSVSIQIYPAEANQQRCDLQLALVLPEGVQAPNGIALILQVDDQVWEETTDESGLFIFAQAVSLDATKLRIAAEILP